MEIAIVTVQKCFEESVANAFRFYVCETLEEGKKLLKAIKGKFLEENPEILDERDTRRIMADTDVCFNVVDDYATDDLYVRVEMKRPMPTKVILQELDEDGCLI